MFYLLLVGVTNKYLKMALLPNGFAVVKDGLVPVSHVSLKIGVIVVNFGIVWHRSQSRSIHYCIPNNKQKSMSHKLSYSAAHVK